MQFFQSDGSLTMLLTIKNPTDEGKFFCFARNAFGNSLHEIKVRVQWIFIFLNDVAKILRNRYLGYDN